MGFTKGSNVWVTLLKDGCYDIEVCQYKTLVIELLNTSIVRFDNETIAVNNSQIFHSLKLAAEEALRLNAVLIYDYAKKLTGMIKVNAHLSQRI